MYKLFIVMFCCIAFISCGDEANEDNGTLDTNGVDTVLTHAKSVEGKPGENYLDGVDYNTDSVAYQALMIYSKVELRNICVSILENIIIKNNATESLRQRQLNHGFEMNTWAKDSLKYYGFDEQSISHTDPNKPIYITGMSPYSEKGKWETVTIGHTDFEREHPVLYRRAISIFMANNNPQITGINITDKSSKSIDYSADFTYADKQHVYIFYNIKNMNQKLSITLNENE